MAASGDENILKFDGGNLFITLNILQVVLCDRCVLSVGNGYSLRLERTDSLEHPHWEAQVPSCPCLFPPLHFSPVLCSPLPSRILAENPTQARLQLGASWRGARLPPGGAIKCAREFGKGAALGMGPGESWGGPGGSYDRRKLPVSGDRETLEMGPWDTLHSLRLMSEFLVLQLLPALFL